MITERRTAERGAALGTPFSLLSTRELIGLCRRVATLLRSGVDVRRVWDSETQHGSSRSRRAALTILEHVKQGETISAGMRASGAFPPVMLAMVEIGDHTGKLDEALFKLAEHYEHQVRLQRQFLLGIAWPMIELIAAVFIIAGLIYALGIVGSITNSDPVDVTGIGLTGAPGALVVLLAAAVAFVAVIGGTIALLRGWFGPWPVQVAMRVPLVGAALRYTALSRLTWALGMSLDAGMDAKRSVELSLLATQNPFFLALAPEVVASIDQHREFFESFRDAKGFPDDFLLELETAEIAGTLSESLVRMSRSYDEQARNALAVLTTLATFVIMAGTMLIMVVLIFRLFWIVYLKPQYELLDDINKGRI
jgi:type IV pilus assembly protein PilC